MTSRRLYNREYQQRQRAGLPCERQRQSLNPDSAMYVHRDPFGNGIWEAKHANRSDIVGYGQTRAEAIIECEKVLNQKIDEEFGSAIKEQAESLKPTEYVGVLHVA